MGKYLLLLFAFLVVGTLSAQDLHASGTRKEGSNKKKVLFTCPVHQEVRMSTKGDCPKCGTRLKREKGKELSEIKKGEEKIYYCGMHPEQTFRTPGTCSACGHSYIERKQ